MGGGDMNKKMQKIFDYAIKFVIASVVIFGIVYFPKLFQTNSSSNNNNNNDVNNNTKKIEKPNIVVNNNKNQPIFRGVKANNNKSNNSANP